MKTVSIDELIERDLGKTGTPERDKFDAKIQTQVIAYQLKQLRTERKYTQQQLAEMVGFDKTQISKIERGSRNLTIETISRVVHALGGTFSFNIQAM